MRTTVITANNIILFVVQLKKGATLFHPKVKREEKQCYTRAKMIEVLANCAEYLFIKTLSCYARTHRSIAVFR